MHIIPRRVPAGQASSPQAKRLPSSGWANADNDDDAQLAARQVFTTVTPVVFTGEGFTFTLNGPATFTIRPPATTTTTTPVVANTPPPPPPPPPPAPPIVSVSSGFVAAPPTQQTPVVSVISPNPSSDRNKSNNNTTTSNAAAQNNTPLGASLTNKGSSVPTGAIIGIALAIVLLILAAFVFLVRQRAIRQRKLRRATAPWATGAAGFAQPPPIPAGSFGGYADAEKSMMDDQNPGMAFARAQAAALSAPPMAVPMAPPSAYGAPAPVVPLSSTASGTATVRYEFIPSLPDELSIVTGEVVRVVAEYDDGWALCANSRNEQGMVPLECLDRNTGGGLLPPGRNSRRGSSLGNGY
ncbi:SH3 domain-containing protein [Mycena indigotica]|uniref:SH3 domain-containing protein n=1 Tax=Mycena indigotica TaxID=2126181 RepID=A0A8H6VZ66_9AGAR|nr:SH3 domain-containing protein [Mycena indigotica]KAF7295668.1 SH3 domain-containing protein [Mycena indigotica]